MNSATYEDVREASANESVLIIDVREPRELHETGTIPSSINIPLGDVEKTFKELSDHAFKEKFGVPKPSMEFPLITSCKSGKRAAEATKILNSLGYKQIRTYAGGWLEWESRNKAQNEKNRRATSLY